MKPILYLCGAGNLEAIRLAVRINDKLDKWKEIVLLDDDPKKHGKSILGVKVIGPFTLLEDVDPNSSYISNLVAKTTKKRQLARQKIEVYGLPFAPLIDPDVELFGVEHKNDITIYQYAVFAAGAFVDEGSVVFMGAMVGHGCRIGKNCIIAPGAVINARVQINDGVYIGTNASVLPDLTIGSWATIGLNSAVVENVSAGATVMGVPAQEILISDELSERVVPPKSMEQQLKLEGDTEQPSPSMEKALTQIWNQVLDVKKIGKHDNFFELGGDSILAIQIISKANQAGIQVTLRQLLDNQTIAELSKVVTSFELILEDYEIVKGPVLLTPIQHWFLEQEMASLHHYNQTMLLKVQKDIDIHMLESTFGEIIKHHDSLRLRFSKTDEGWQQEYGELDENFHFSRIDLSANSPKEQKTALDSSISDLQASLNLSEGPIFKAVYFDFGSDHSGRLLLVIHHLAVDGVSWRILLEDIQIAYRQLTKGESIKLPPKTSSFQQWAKNLSQYAESSKILSELDFWLSDSRKHIKSIPRDFKEESNMESAAQKITTSLAENETQILLKKVPAAYDVQINDVLLAALTLALSKWTRESKILLDLEGHGREDIINAADVSRTIGWFTSIFPVVLEIATNKSERDVLTSVKEQLEEIPSKGIGYGLLRYLRDDIELRQRLMALPQAEIQFNYLGQFDQMFSGSSIFEPASEPPGVFAREASPSQRRPYLLEVLGMVVDDKLRMEWIYNKDIHKQSTVKGLAAEFMNCLSSLLSKCATNNKKNSTTPNSSIIDVEREKKHYSKGKIRPCTSDDIPQIVDLNIKHFPSSVELPSVDIQAQQFLDVFFNNPWQDNELPSLVFEDNRGKIAGFLGVMPRRMIVNGKSLRVAVSHRYMIDPEYKSSTASIELLEKYLSGPQDLSLADGANDTSRKVWEGLGGTTSQIFSIGWEKPLRPINLMANHMKEKKVLAPFVSIAAPIIKLLDGIAVRLPVGRYHQSTDCDTEEDLSPETMIEHIHQFSNIGWLCPEYDIKSLQWLLDIVSRSGQRGNLRKSVVRDEDGRIIGWYIYFLKSGGISSVLQIWATEHSASKVLRSLFYSAWKGGSIKLFGRIEPRFMHEFSKSSCNIKPFWWVLVHSKDPELKGFIERGEAILSRLDGEPWWML